MGGWIPLPHSWISNWSVVIGVQYILWPLFWPNSAYPWHLFDPLFVNTHKAVRIIHAVHLVSYVYCTNHTEGGVPLSPANTPGTWRDYQNILPLELPLPGILYYHSVTYYHNQTRPSEYPFICFVVFLSSRLSPKNYTSQEVWLRPPRWVSNWRYDTLRPSRPPGPPAAPHRATHPHYTKCPLYCAAQRSNDEEVGAYYQTT